MSGLLKTIFKQLILPRLMSGGKFSLNKTLLYSIAGLYAAYGIARANGLLKKKSVNGKHIFITGAGSGIGKQMAIAFAGRGALLSIADLNEESVQQLAQALVGAGKVARAYKLDVCDYKQVYEVAAQATQALGPVDILINNAGIVSGKKILENTEGLIEKTINVNATSHHWTVRAFLPKMLEQNSGHIVTIASISGVVGVCGLADYAASKFAAFGFDESLRMELRKLKSNVKTTCICPYYINTGMFDGVKSKFSLLLPILSQSYATNRIVNAILQDEKVVIMPYIGYLIPFFRSILPTCLFDWTLEFLGASDSMDAFKGRKN